MLKLSFMLVVETRIGATKLERSALGAVADLGYTEDSEVTEPTSSDDATCPCGAAGAALDASIRDMC
jgi:hypothetical protein